MRGAKSCKSLSSPLAVDRQRPVVARPALGAVFRAARSRHGAGDREAVSRGDNSTGFNRETIGPSEARQARLERDDFFFASSSRSSFCLSKIFSENRCPLFR